MGRKVFAVEQIIRNLHEVEVLCGQGKTIGEALGRMDAVRVLKQDARCISKWRDL
jgi:hypothetical protein